MTKALRSIIIALTLVAAWSCLRERHYDIDRAQYPVKGIDVSSHNGNIDFGRVAADSVMFVIIKATEGTDFCDALLSRNYEKARNAGLKVGPYHFFRFDSPGHIQAYHFLSAIADKTWDLPLTIDVEDWQNATDVPELDVITQLQAMANVLEAAGYRVMIYTNKKGYEKYVQPTLYGTPLWICSLGESPDEYGWKLWQHSHRGLVDGIEGLTDMNTYNGTVEEFEQWLRAQ